MEKEHDNKMCYMCGNEYGRKYSWTRLALALVIGLFIFFAGMEIGQMRMQAYGGTYRGPMMHWHSYGNNVIIDSEESAPASPAPTAQ